MYRITLTKKHKQFVYLGVAIFWMLLIFSFSSQNGTTSGGLSTKVLQTLGDFFRVDIVNSDYYETFQLLIRKGAHMFEYFMLAIWLYLFWYHTTFKDQARIFAFLSSFLYACTDEVHQLFIADRAGQVQDVLIDTTGIVVAMLLFPILHHHLYHRKDT